MDKAKSFFNADAGSSDDDTTDTSSVSTVESSESDVSSYWLQFTDDEGADGQDGDGGFKRENMSKQEKSLETIDKLCSEVDYAAIEASWTSALGIFETLRPLVQAHADRYRELPVAFTDLLEGLPNSSDELKDKSKSDFKSARDLASLRKLVGLVQEAAEFVTDAVKSIEEAKRLATNLPDKEDDGTMTEKKCAEKITELASQRRNKAISLGRIASTCGTSGFVGLEITALAMQVFALIEEDSGSNYTPLSTWSAALASATSCVERVLANPQVTVGDDTLTLRSDRAGIVGGLKEVVMVLYTHITRAAQWVPVNSIEYLPIPSLENSLAALADTVLTYYLGQTSRRAARNAVGPATVLLDILGNRPPAAHAMLFAALKGQWKFVTASVAETVEKLVSTLVKLECDDDIAMRGLCYIAYQRGLAGQYRQGRDLLLRSGVEEFVGEAVSERKSYELAVCLNRAIAQLALAAFIAGDIQQSYQLIGTLWSCRDPDAQLGQRMGGRGTESGEIVLALHDLLVPAHLRIPYEHLEMVAMLSALAVDTLAEAQNPYERTKLQSYFYRTVTNRRQQLVGKPSSVSEQVAAAYRSLKTGDYQSTKDVVESMSAWLTFPSGDKVRAQFLESLKERALQIFCYVNRCKFSTFSVEQLALKYELSESRAHDVMTQCIADSSNALTAFWDRDDKFLVVDRNNMSRLQHLVYSTATSMGNLDPFTERRMRANDVRGRGRGRGRGGFRGGR